MMKLILSTLAVIVSVNASALERPLLPLGNYFGEHNGAELQATVSADKIDIRVKSGGWNALVAVGVRYSVTKDAEKNVCKLELNAEDLVSPIAATNLKLRLIFSPLVSHSGIQVFSHPEGFADSGSVPTVQIQVFGNDGSKKLNIRAMLTEAPVEIAGQVVQDFNIEG